MNDLEQSLFQQVCRQIAAMGQAHRLTASGVGHIDVYAALAEGAARHGYVRPRLDNGSVIDIKEGRHPVVELTNASRHVCTQ